MKRRHGFDYNICPPSYILTEDYKRFIVEREAEANKSLYIIKPVASSCGRGIKIIGKKTILPKRK
jgi:glutathionylspermidine synthase